MPTSNIEHHLAHEKAASACSKREFSDEPTHQYTQVANALEMQPSPAKADRTALGVVMSGTETADDEAAFWATPTHKSGQGRRARRIALIGTFTPRRCGVATFCSDLVEQLARFHPHIAFDIYVVDDPLQPLHYQGVAGIIAQNEPASYLAAAQRINESGADAVWLQHEYSIFGGVDGEVVRDLVEAIAPPLILTPHTILSAPSERQEAILRHLVERASRIMVMSDHSGDLLAARYGVPDDMVEIIPHGAPDGPYAKGRQTIWPRFARAAAALIESVIPASNRALVIVARPSLSGVFAMSDGTGILQHSNGIVPDRRHGYCLDDNARALMLMSVATGISFEERTRRSMTYASFIQHAWNEEHNTFRNFMNFDRSWCEETGSEDSNGRALWALGHTFENAPDRDLRGWAKRWYERALPHCARFASPRTIAFAMLGAVAVLGVEPGHRASRDLLSKGGSALRSLLASARRPNWTWFEAGLSYDNLRLPQALIEAGLALPDQGFVDNGLETLEWIAGRQTAARGHFRPVGSRGFDIEHGHLPFDQQPLEAQAAIDAAAAAYLATGATEWLGHGKAAWNWFVGANDRSAAVGDLISGRCFDGVNPRGLNLNCGAESILAFHLSYYSQTALACARVGSATVEDAGDRTISDATALRAQ